MNITLRKASALQNSIQEYIKGIEIKLTATLNEFEDAEATLSALNARLLAADEHRNKLTNTLYRIRSLVGIANATSGISDKLAECAFIDKRIGHMTALATSEVQDSLAVVNGKLDKLRNDKSESRRSVFGYNDTVTVGVLREDQITAYKGIVMQLKKQKQKLNDEILELNVRTEITLPEDLLPPLQEVGLV
jgi:chromosome segregation ATPase